MLASFPASMLNQKPADLGILNRFKLDPYRSSDPRHDLGQLGEAPILAGSEQKLHVDADMGPVRTQLFFDHRDKTAGQGRRVPASANSPGVRL